jgi:hypothetical protein
VVAVQPPFGGGEAVSDAPCSALDSYGSHLLVGVPKLAPFCAYPMDTGVDGRAGAKSLREADDGDARGRRHLLGGVVMALSVLPHLELKEICPRGNNNIVIIIFLVHDNVYTPCYNCIKRKH